MSRTLTALITVGCVAATPLAAQGLRDELGKLFTFGSCGQPLCLDVSGVHGSHFLPSVNAGNATVIDFLTASVSRSASSTPISATSSGATYTIVDGLPVRTSISAGPIFAERSQTLGKGRFFLGTNISSIHFTTLNGVPTDNLELNFTHQDVPPAGLGDPSFENDVIRMQLQLDVNLVVGTLFATYGVTDFLDVGVAVPMERVSLSGTSVAQIDPFGPNPQHFFGGTSANPILRATSSVNASASGVGDVVGRVKINLGQGAKMGAALLGEVRFPTGSEANLLGSGSTTAKAMGVFAAQFGSFAVHTNAGYVLRTGQLQNDAIAASFGFDNLASPWATFAFSVLSEWRVGAPKQTLPGPTEYVFPFVREVQATNIPYRREDRLDAALGAKFNVRGGTVLMVNGIVPLRRAGLQPDFTWTDGVEFAY